MRLNPKIAVDNVLRALDSWSCSEQLYSILNSKEKLERLRSNKKNAFNIKSIVLELKS